MYLAHYFSPTYLSINQISNYFLSEAMERVRARDIVSDISDILLKKSVALILVGE